MASIITAKNDDLRINSEVLPVQGDVLTIPGVSFPVTVIRLENRDYVDGKGEAVVTIYLKGSNRSETALLSPSYISSLDLFEIHPSPEPPPGDKETDADGSGEIDSDWENLSSAPDLGKEVRKYFDGHGWYNGKVQEVWTNHESKRYIVMYDEDDDAEEMDEAEFKEWSSYFAQRPQPSAPLALVRARAQAAAKPNLAADERVEPMFIVAAAPAADAAASSSAPNKGFLPAAVAAHSGVEVLCPSESRLPSKGCAIVKRS